MNCKYDEWLSSILKKDAYHLSNFAPDDVNVLDALPKKDGLFVDSKVPVGEVVTISTLSDLGFMLVDTNITFEHEGVLPWYVSPGSEASVRFSIPEDEEIVSQIARSAFSLTRFHNDPAIENEIANSLKESWARNYFKGTRGNWMVVAERKYKVIGFLQLLEKDDGTLVIDLIGVDSDYRGAGCGRAMISFAFENCRKENAKVLVGTQLVNYNSLRFYQSLGFVIKKAEHVLHFHG